MRQVNVVAECCCNHMGDIAIAKEMIRQAKACGADFVKFQKRDISSMSKEQRDKPYDGPHSFGTTYGEHRYMLEFSKDQWWELEDLADKVGIGFFATPFDLPSAEFIHCGLDTQYVKLGSTQIHDQGMIDYFKRHREKKIIMSSGMMEFFALERLVAEVGPHVVMQTTSAYPCDEADVNLLAIRAFTTWGRDVGLSGHYVSGNGALEAAAVALGATWIERHFTLDRTWKGSDQASSLEPAGLHNVVKAVRSVARALGDGRKKFEECEQSTWEKVKK